MRSSSISSDEMNQHRDLHVSHDKKTWEGRALTIVRAKNARATLAASWSVEKLLRMFPCVSFTKLQYPPRARVSPITRAMEIDHLETQAQRSVPPLDMLRYTRNDELWHTNAKDIAPKPAKIVGRMNVSLSEGSMSGFSLFFVFSSVQNS